MKLTDYIKNLQEFEKEYGDLTVITSRDEEGNGYNEVYFTPCLGTFEDHDFDQECEEEFNAICVN